MKPRQIGVMIGAVLFSVSVLAGVPKDLPYPPPGKQLTGDEIAAQVYFVNHFYALKNYSIDIDGDTVTVLINKAKGERPTTNTVERHLNNDYDDGVTKAKDLAIFHSGKLRGTGMLIVDFVDDSKSQSYTIWLPALRKIRRFAQPAQEDAWGGTDFTFGDVTLRKPMDETHELLGTETFNDCLGFVTIPDDQLSKWTKDIKQEGSCAPKGKKVYKLKSTTKFPNWWYDYRISYVDTETFADYRTEYFKDGKMIKVIDRDWGSLGLPDKRALFWRYWYGKNLETGHETWAVIPEEIVKYNRDMDPKLWTEGTLRRIKR
jgi:hypothetical protein